jgi:hypothetical protein
LILIRAVALYLPFGSSVSQGLFKGHNAPHNRLAV